MVSEAPHLGYREVSDAKGLKCRAYTCTLHRSEGALLPLCSHNSSAVGLKTSTCSALQALCVTMAVPGQNLQLLFPPPHHPISMVLPAARTPLGNSPAPP